MKKHFQKNFVLLFLVNKKSHSNLAMTTPNIFPAKTKKASTFRPRLNPLFHHHQAVVSAFRPPHTAQRIASSAISFRFPPVSISAAASFRLTLVFHFRFRLSLGLPVNDLLPFPFRFLTPAVFAFFRPLQFWVLTTQPLFLPFPFLPVSASQWLPQCSALAFAPSVFPVLSCLVSHPFFPGSGTQLRCMFPFTLP